MNIFAKKLFTYYYECQINLLKTKKMKRILNENILSKLPGRCYATNNDEEDYVEGVVCKETDINENEMKQFELGDAGKILLVKQFGKYSALGTKCTHYGAPLSTGALGEGRIRCPWHGACFNLATGDIEDFPGEDSIPCYQVTVEDGNVKVRAKRSEVKANKRVKTMVLRNTNDERTFVIIGGGPSGAICAETLRQEGFTGRIVMVCKEPYLPYDRIKVSKTMDADIEKLQLRNQEFYNNNTIETMTGVEATNVDSVEKQVTLSNGYKIKYDRMYIATGSNPRKLNIPGSELKQVATVRNYSDAAFIHSELSPEKHVVILGVSFIGLEAAAYCVNKVAKVTLIGRDTVPLKPVFGEEIGTRVMEMFKEKGVEFIMQSGIRKCNETDGVLTSVELNNGENLKADICIMGVGSTFFTSFLSDSGIEINSNGSINTDLYLESNIRDIYVGGDIANAPVFALGQEKVTIGHYSLAQYHGRIAALNMCGKRTALSAVPFFFTFLFGKSFRYAGHGTPNSIQIVGNLQELSFYAFYFDVNDKVIAVSSCGFNNVVAHFAEYLSKGKTLYKSQLTEDNTLGWTKE